MTLKIAFQMDPIGPINIDADSTFRIAEEAQARGHSLFYYTPDQLAYREGRVMARGYSSTYLWASWAPSSWSALSRCWT